MPDEVEITSRTDSASVTTQTESSDTVLTSAADKSNPGPDLTPYLVLCAAGLLASFFMPWVKILFGRPSGYDLQQLGDLHRLYWAIPAFSAVAIIAALTKTSQRSAAQLAGAVPYVILVYWIAKFGSNYMELLKSLEYGGYVALICGAALEVLGSRMK